jgi:inner membrane protein
MQPVDSYQKIDRAQKYALLFIVLTFATLFFLEMFKNEQVHALNYILIGLAINMFYVVLLSLSEHIGFDGAYGVATIVITTMIGWHSRNILIQRSLWRTVAGTLLTLYGFMYVLLHLQDFALVVGTAGLLTVLAALMKATGRVTAPKSNSQ